MEHHKRIAEFDKELAIGRQRLAALREEIVKVDAMIQRIAGARQYAVECQAEAMVASVALPPAPALEPESEPPTPES